MRYLPLTPDDRAAMLSAIGASSIDDLFVDVPESARLDAPVDLPRVQGELEVERALSAMAGKNATAGTTPFFCGAGAYKHHVPATVDHIIQRSEFLTSYTPYQPEIAQGTLQYLYEFQTQVANLTGMPVANASLYDGSTAMAEGVLMATRVTRRNKAVISGGVHPHYVKATETVVHAVGVETQALSPAVDAEAAVIDAIGPDTACVVVQSIGNALNFGGPYVGLFATREKLIRQMPGRLTGETVDADGERGFVLTLSTREQHIRRDKATSNICTNSGLCTLAFTIHMSLLGETGLRKLALLNHEKAMATRDALAAVPGVEVLTPRFFNEFAVRLPKNAAEVVDQLAEHRILAGVPYSRLNPEGGPKEERWDDVLLVAATETTLDADIKILAGALSKVLAG